MIGVCPQVQAVFEQIRQAAATDVPVLISGETGTGKDLAAQAIHDLSARRQGPYLPVHLGAIPTNLVASELFGHAKGVFTGATEARKGKFELGDKGTVFLDEISTINEKVQISLLRLIEHKRFHRLGGRETITNDVRIIAASNTNLLEAVQRGTFREDLYYRLDVFRIDLPPLRDRAQDIPLFVEAFVDRFSRRFRKRISTVEPECIRLLAAYDWPGNVRELKNVIQRGVLVCTGNVLLPEHLPPRFQADQQQAQTVSFEIGTPLAEMEREMIRRVLLATNNNRKQTAEILGISRRTLYNKLERYAIEAG